MENLKDFAKNYLNFLKSNLSVKKIETAHEIVLPFEDHIGDSIVCYVDDKKENGMFLVSDDGYIINNLIDTGINIDKKSSRRKTIEQICMLSGVSLSDDNEMTVLSSEKDLPSKVHQLAMTMLQIDDMYLTNTVRTTSYFLEDVTNFFIKNDIYFSDNVSFVGRSGLTQKFDLCFQRNKNHNERLCKAINNPTRDSLTTTVFAWLDIEKTRNDAKCIVILNDAHTIKSDIVQGFKQYGIMTVPFSDLEKEKGLFS
jgi:hypothetical protein